MSSPATQDRVVVLLDMDCFYVQVEQQLAPETCKLPCAVVQYNNWRGGSVLAVDYTAREYGVTRGMTGEEATAKCPQLHLFKVPEKRGKADLTRYRQMGAKVIRVLSQHCDHIERASVDEAFLELSSLPCTHPPSAEDIAGTKIAGWFKRVGEDDDECKGSGELIEWLDKEGIGEERGLAVAAVLVRKIREAVRKDTGCTCSAGIAHNKMLAKLAAGMNKPNGQTILPSSCVANVLSTTPLRKIRYLGGKLGNELIQRLNIVNTGQLCDITMETLQTMFGQKTGTWLYELCRGNDREVVRARQLPKSLGCGKNFPGPTKLKSVEQIKHWLNLLSSELVERLVEDKYQNRRYAKQISVHFQSSVCEKGMSRCCSLPAYDCKRIAEAAWTSIEHHCISLQLPSEGLVQLSLSANKFTDCSSHQTLESLLLQSSSLSKKRCREDNDIICNDVKKERDDDEIVREGDSEYPDEILEVCCECRKKFPVWLISTHKDHHMAIKLQTQEQHSVESTATKTTVITLDKFFNKK